jgi:WD40 repeat protein/tRNA A-37 threonylcarbamoyl transferase component Bud32
VDDLQRFLLGSLPAAEAERSEQHLIECAGCLATVRALKVDDTLTEAMRAGAAVAAQATVSLDDAQPLIDKMIALHPCGAQVADDASVPPPPGALPEQIGRYRILGRLGAGGMGTVYKAEDTQLRRVVAVKVPRFDGPEESRQLARQRFLREARAAAQVRHPHVCPLHDVGEHDGMPFVVMDFVEGQSLAERLVGGARYEDPAEAVALVCQVAEALEAVHGHGLVHRDVKPGNVLLDRSGRAVLTDFGLARPTDDAEHLTSSGALVGTPAFMAPEQVSLTAEPVGPWTDVYSLGVVLYRLLTGRVPFEGPMLAVVHSIGYDDPPPPSRFRPDLDSALEAIVQKAMARRREDRYPSARAFAEALQGWLGATVQLPVARAPGRPAEAVPKDRRRLPGFVKVAAAILLLVGGGLLVPQIIVRIYDDKGKLVSETKLPPGFQVKVDGNKPEQPRTEPVKLLPREGLSTLDKLRPEMTPAAERFAWQPKELVAVLGEHRGRHWGTVRQVVYSPDGKFVVTGGDGGVVLWDPQTLRQRALLPGHHAAVAVSPDSKILATFTYDALGWAVRLWDVGDGEPKERTVLITEDTVICLAFAPDGKTLAGGCSGKTVRLWDVTAVKPKEQAVLKGHTGRVVTVAFAPDGKTLASGSEDNTFRLWDLSGAEPKEKAVTTIKGPPFQLVFSPDCKTLAGCGHWGPMAILWDVTGAEPKERAVIQRGFPQTGSAVALSPDGKTLACGSLHGSYIALFDLTGAEPKERAVIGANNPEDGCSVAFSPDGTSLVQAGAQKGVLRLWDLSGDEPKERLEPRGHTAALTSLAFTPDGTKLATGGDATVRLWDLTGTAPREWAVLRDLGGRVDSVAFTPDGKVLAIGGADLLFLRNVTGADLEERAVFKRWRGPHRLAFSPDGKTLLCTGIVGDQWVVRVLDVTEAEPRERAVLKVGGPLIALAPDGKTLASSETGPDGPFVRLRNLKGAEPKERAVLKSPPSHYNSSALAWSPDGKTLAASFPSSGNPRCRTLLLWDLSGAEPRQQCNLFTEHLPVATALVFTPDGKTLVYAGSSGELILWDVVGHRNLQELGRNYKDSGGETVLWDAVSRKHYKQQHRWQLPGAVLSLALAPDGRHLATANSNGTAYLLRLAPPAK